MLALLLGMIASALASFSGIYGLLSVVCYIADHDWLVMMHMYSSSVILALAAGILLPLRIGELQALRDQIRRRALIS